MGDADEAIPRLARVCQERAGTRGNGDDATRGSLARRSCNEVTLRAMAVGLVGLRVPSTVILALDGIDGKRMRDGPQLGLGQQVQYSLGSCHLF